MILVSFYCHTLQSATFCETFKTFFEPQLASLAYFEPTFEAWLASKMDVQICFHPELNISSFISAVTLTHHWLKTVKCNVNLSD